MGGISSALFPGLIMALAYLRAAHAWDRVCRSPRAGGCSLRLRGGGFAAVVPVSSLLAQTAENRKTAAQQRMQRGDAQPSAEDAALLEALKDIEDDGECQARVLELLNGGASASALDPTSSCDYTALHLAASRGLSHAAVSALVTGGASVDAPAKHGQTPLSLAAARGHNNTVDSLLSLGASVAQKDMLGWTPLHQAAYYSSEQIVVRLLAAGADPTAKTNDGATAMGLAHKNPLTHPETAKAIADSIALASFHYVSRSGQRSEAPGVDDRATAATDSADSIVKLDTLPLGDDSPIMQTAKAKGQSLSDATDAALQAIRRHYKVASAAPLETATDENSTSTAREAEENVLNDVLDACTKEGGSAEDQLKRALQMLQQGGNAATSSLGLSRDVDVCGHDRIADNAAPGPVPQTHAEQSRALEGDGGTALGVLTGAYQCMCAHVAASPEELTVHVGEDVRVELESGEEHRAQEARGYVRVSSSFAAGGGGRKSGYIPRRCLVDGLPVPVAGGRVAGNAEDGGAVRVQAGEQGSVKSSSSPGLTGGQAYARSFLQAPWSLLDVASLSKQARVSSNLGRRPDHAASGVGFDAPARAGPMSERRQSHFSVRAKMTRAMDLRDGLDGNLDDLSNMQGGGRREPPAQVCGIGVSITADEQGRYVVRAVDPAGPAGARVGEVRHGDVLQAVDGHPVTGISPAALTNLVLGDANSSVCLTLLSPAPSGTVYESTAGEAGRQVWLVRQPRPEAGRISVRESEATGGAEGHGRRSDMALPQGGGGGVASQEAPGAPAIRHAHGPQSAGQSRERSTSSSRSPADVEEEFGEL